MHSSWPHSPKSFDNWATSSSSSTSVSVSASGFQLQLQLRFVVFFTLRICFIWFRISNLVGFFRSASINLYYHETTNDNDIPQARETMEEGDATKINIGARN